jgi:hypothetical protein
MSDAKMPRKKGNKPKPKPKQPSTQSEPAAPQEGKSVSPWELTEEMTDEQLDQFAEGLVRLFKKAEARDRLS